MTTNKETYWRKKRSLPSTNQQSRDALYNALMEECSRYSQLDAWEKVHVASLLLHKLNEQERNKKEEFLHD